MARLRSGGSCGSQSVSKRVMFELSAEESSEAIGRSVDQRQQFRVVVLQHQPIHPRDFRDDAAPFVDASCPLAVDVDEAGLDPFDSRREPADRVQQPALQVLGDIRTQLHAVNEDVDLHGCSMLLRTPWA